MSYNPNHCELTPEEKLRLTELNSLVESRKANKKEIAEWTRLKMLSETW